MWLLSSWDRINVFLNNSVVWSHIQALYASCFPSILISNCHIPTCDECISMFLFQVCCKVLSLPTEAQQIYKKKKKKKSKAESPAIFFLYLKNHQTNSNLFLNWHYWLTDNVVLLCSTLQVMSNCYYITTARLTTKKINKRWWIVQEHQAIFQGKTLIT